MNRHDPKKTLAEGEVTGHAHVLQRTEVKDASNGGKVFSVKEDDVLVHEEHGPVTIPVGDWASGIVREQNHFQNEAEKVKD